MSSCGVELTLGGADHLPSDVYTVIRFCENKQLITCDLQRSKNSWDLFLVQNPFNRGMKHAWDF